MGPMGLEDDTWIHNSHMLPMKESTTMFGKEITWCMNDIILKGSMPSYDHLFVLWCEPFEWSNEFI